MSNYTFPLDAQGFSGEGVSWAEEEGNPAGSLYFSGVDAGDAGSLGDLNIPANEGDPVSFQFRIIATEISEGDLELAIYLEGTGINGGSHVFPAGEWAVPFDSGWVDVEGQVLTSGTITAIGLVVVSSNVFYEAWFDNVYVAEAPPSPPYTLTHSAGGIPGSILEVTP